MNMNEVLPIEMIREIFGYLSIRNSLRCRSVCKLWCSVSSSLRHSKLSIVRQNARPVVFGREKAAYEPARSIYFMEPANDSCFWGLLNETTLRNVREMCTLFTNVDPRYLLNFYNHFVNLETLTIDSNDCLQMDYKFPMTMIVLNLKCLKKLTVNTDYFCFTLNTPELLNLKCNSFPRSFRFEYQDKIKFLSADKIDQTGLGVSPQILPELEILVLRRAVFDAHPEVFLNGLSSLKEIHLDQHFVNLIPFLESIRQHRKHFEIFVLGIHLKFSKNMNGHDAKKQLERRTDILVRGVPMMAERVFCEFAINYEHLEPLSRMERELFLGKFEKIRSVSVNKKAENERLLLEIVEKARPDHFKLVDFDLYSQSFFDQLSLNCQFLRALSLEAASQNFKENGYRKFCDFLLKLNNLTCLQLDLYRLVFENNTFSLHFGIYVLTRIPSLKDCRIYSRLLKLEICNDWRMNAVIVYYGMEPMPPRRAYPFWNKSDCINFLNLLKNIWSQEDFDRLPYAPNHNFLGYLKFRD